MTDPCACGAPVHARGLCNKCYKRAYRAGTLDDVATRRPLAEVLDEWVLLRDDGISVRDAAPRLGMTFPALDQHLVRARRRGDPRGNRKPFGRG